MIGMLLIDSVLVDMGMRLSIVCISVVLFVLFGLSMLMNLLGLIEKLMLCRIVWLFSLSVM